MAEFAGLHPNGCNLGCLREDQGSGIGGCREGPRPSRIRSGVQFDPFADRLELSLPTRKKSAIPSAVVCSSSSPF